MFSGGGLVAKSCLTLATPLTPGSFVHGILQARILEWVAISFSRESLQSRNPTRVPFIAGRFSTNWVTREVRVFTQKSFLPNPRIIRTSLWGGGLKIICHSFYKKLLSTYYVPDDRPGAGFMKLYSQDHPRSESRGWSLAKFFRSSLITDDILQGRVLAPSCCSWRHLPDPFTIRGTLFWGDRGWLVNLSWGSNFPPVYLTPPTMV